MSGRAGTRAAALFATALALTAGATQLALADPAATADSAWAPLPAAGGPRPDDPLARRGKDVFDQRCAACHGPLPEQIHGPASLPTMPGTQALTTRYQGALPALLEERRDLTAAQIRSVVRSGFESMTPLRPTEVSDEDLDALVAWLTRPRDARGND